MNKATPKTKKTARVDPVRLVSIPRSGLHLSIFGSSMSAPAEPAPEAQPASSRLAQPLLLRVRPSSVLVADRSIDPLPRCRPNRSRWETDWIYPHLHSMYFKSLVDVLVNRAELIGAERRMMKVCGAVRKVSTGLRDCWCDFRVEHSRWSIFSVQCAPPMSMLPQACQLQTFVARYRCSRGQDPSLDVETGHHLPLSMRAYRTLDKGLFCNTSVATDRTTLNPPCLSPEQADPRSPGADIARGGQEGGPRRQAVEEAEETRADISQALGAGQKNVRKVPDEVPPKGAPMGLQSAAVGTSVSLLHAPNRTVVLFSLDKAASIDPLRPRS